MSNHLGSLLGIPAWNQNRDPLPDGTQDPYHDTDCGEECVAMRLYYRTGRELSAGQVRALIPGHQTYGQTTGPELVKVMHVLGLSPVIKYAAMNAVLQTVRRAVTAGVPPIVLGNWVSPSILHWVLVVGASDIGWVVNDPWGGQRYYLPASKVLTRYGGACIV